MKSSHALAAALVALAPAAAMPSEYDVPLVRRAVGDRCTAPEGTGSCQHTAACAGISYPQALCPRDPNDVQCCVTIGCTSRGRAGHCRSVAHNGCPGGAFDPANLCPGSQDIQCCVPGSSHATCTSKGRAGTCRSVSTEGCAGGVFDPANLCPGSQDIQCCVPSAPPPQNPCTASETDRLIFSTPIAQFHRQWDVKSPGCFDWSSDDCSGSPDNPLGFDFNYPCRRHDFGYRNSKKQGRCTEAYRKRVDDNFQKDLYDYCAQFSGLESWKGVECRRLADTYHEFVRGLGSC